MAGTRPIARSRCCRWHRYCSPAWSRALRSPGSAGPRGNVHASALSVPADLDRQLAIAMDETGGNALGLAEHVYAHPPLGHLFQQHRNLQFGEACANAAMDAVPERQVPTRIRTIDDDL